MTNFGDKLFLSDATDTITRSVDSS